MKKNFRCSGKKCKCSVLVCLSCRFKKCPHPEQPDPALIILYFDVNFDRYRNLLQGKSYRIIARWFFAPRLRCEIFIGGNYRADAGCTMTCSVPCSNEVGSTLYIAHIETINWSVEVTRLVIDQRSATTTCRSHRFRSETTYACLELVAKTIHVERLM